jgi:predicted ATPase/class 3 adenylate cyclase
MMAPVGRDLPSGTVTFLFTDVESSTKLLHELGAEGYAMALAEHRRVLREAFEAHRGVEVDTQGDAFFVAFPTATGALDAARAITEDLASGPIRLRIGLHTGTPLLTDEGYVGPDVHRAARIAAAGHGGQVLVSSSTAGLVDLELRDLGEHRFKDLAAPERVYQLDDADFPALKSLYRTNLPVPPTPFLGRERELGEVVDLLSGDDVRLLTLTGPGGTGKTRLAVQAGAEVSDRFPDGVFWVPLAPLRDPSLVPAVVAQALEVNERPGAALNDAIVGAYAAGRALVLLDNCEHLVGAVADVVAALVEGCPQLVIAASSRERLGLRAERVYAVPPMGASDSEALFVVRARAAQADFAPDDHVPAICEAVDGLPLAVELAAARVRSLSTQAILERLDERLSLLATRDRDVDERQRTLAATIAWSYDLLEAEERRALRALSVFAGGCTLEAAEQVAGADLDLLESLLDKSLIRHRVDDAGQDRYWMLETIREFAARELERQDVPEEVRDRHAAWVLGFVREAAPRWGDLAHQAALARVWADEGNIRVALSRASGRHDGNQALELVGLIGQTWMQAGRFKEIDGWAQEALALGGDAHLEGMALLSFGLSDWSTGAESFASATERFRGAGMAREAAYATMCLGLAEAERGFVDRGLEFLEAALAEFERLGDEYCASITRWNIADAQGLRWPLEPAEARRIADRQREVIAAEARRTGLPGDEIEGLESLSHALVAAGELEEAWSTALRAAALMRQGRAGWHSLVGVVAALARSAALRGNAEQALQLAGALRSVSSELGLTMGVTRAAALEAAEASSRDALDDEAAARATAAGEAMTVDSLLEYLDTLE